MRCARGLIVVLALTACQPATPPSTLPPLTLPATTTTTPDSADYSPPPGALNPAVTQATITATICVSGWTATIRPPSSYTTPLKLTQVAARHITVSPSALEEDHLQALETGGAPRDPNNLWPEPIVQAHLKDAAENRIHKAICAGTITLAEGQREMVDPTQWHA